MSNINQFSAEMDREFRKVVTQAQRIVRKAAFDGHKNIVKGTPMDTGRAKAAWQIDLNSTSEIEESLHIAAMSKSTAELVAGQQRSKLGAFKLGDVIHIYNNVEYILPLEYDGVSDQAPSGWVRSEKIRMENKLKEAFRAMRLI